MKKSVLQNPLHNDKAFDIFVVCIISLTLVALLYPLYFVVIASISDPDLVSSGQVWFLPKGVNFEGYGYILHDVRILRGYISTIVYTVYGTLLALFITEIGRAHV